MIVFTLSDWKGKGVVSMSTHIEYGKLELVGGKFLKQILSSQQIH